MKNMLKAITLFLIIFSMIGCAKAVIRSDSDPSINLAALKKFYVRKQPADKRELEKIIAQKLNEFGFQATSGNEPKPPSPVDALVTYKDRWMWDITMYMLEINIEFRNPESEFVFANGKSYRTSLVREPPEVMIDEVLRDMFAGKVVLPEKKVKENKGE
jgi:hypothetical protein